MAGANNLKTWFTPPVAKVLQISTSRWDHVLRLCHPNGESFPIMRRGMASGFSVWPNNEVQEIPYYYFEADTRARREMPWYLEDLSTDPVERILPDAEPDGPTNYELVHSYHLPAPQGLTAVLSAGMRQIGLVWNPAGASLEGGFEIEHKTSDDEVWTTAYQLAALAGARSDGLFHFDVFSIALGIHSYRVRYVYGSPQEFSEWSNVAEITGWQDSDADGMPDAWEMAYFGTLAHAGNGDEDGDDYTNLAEFTNHTNPNALPANAPGSTLIVYTPLQ